VIFKKFFTIFVYRKTEKLMIKLPTEKRTQALRKNPKRLIIYGKPKCGKTTIVGQLDDTLILNMEKGGTDHLNNIMSTNVIGLTPPKESAEARAARHERADYYLSEVITEIRRIKKDTGSYPYQRVVVDTVTQLEEWCEDYATMKYMQSVQGKSFNRVDGKKGGAVLPKNQWESVLTLPQGAGYLWLRLAFADWLSMIDDLAPDIILIAHLKDKLVNKSGKEMTSADLYLTGRIAQIVSASSDAIGYVYRKKNKTYINFKSTDDTCGSRCAHLKGQEICIMEEDADFNIISTHWDDIYVDQKEEVVA
jgi:hypothetical protein